jgi:ribonuclease HIII
VKKANVIILLESGGRVLMDATATGFKFIQFLPSPKNNLNFVATRRSKSPHEESQMRLICGLDESGKGMFMFSTSGTE